MQTTHNSDAFRKLHGALVEIVGIMNRPQRDEAMIKEAGITLDRALFPLLVLIERLGPLGVVELADRVGRDYTTVSRQVAKMESLGLIDRQANATDRRIREAVIAPAGKAMTDSIDEARNRLAQTVFSQWDNDDIVELTRLMCRFVDDIKDQV